MSDETMNAAASESVVSTPIPHEPGPWSLCNDGKCSCMFVSCCDYPVAKVTVGKWGDDYPTIRLEGSSLDTKAVAVMEQITYGEISQELARANARLIAAAPDMLALLQEISTLDEKSTTSLPWEMVLRIRAAIEKAHG